MYLFAATIDGVSTRLMMGCEDLAVAVASSLRTKGYTVSNPEFCDPPIQRDMTEMARARLLLELVTEKSVH